jgi:hypothetical protein
MDLDELAGGVWLRNRKAVILDAVEVKHNCVVNQPRDFLAGIAHRHTAREIRNVGADDGEILHALTSLLQTRLLENATSVPSGTSTLGLPETVAVPGWVG